MSKLETLVPPLELCRQIPEGKFADSALVWLGDGVVERSLVLCDTYPAPTLAEILAALSRYCEPVIVTHWRSGQVSVVIQKDEAECEEVSECMSAAALKLWLDMEARK